MPAAPRIRRSIACDECKRRKVKCSTEPECSNCTRDKKTCVYSSPIHRVSTLQRNLQRHETFIKKVRRAWAQHVPNISLEQALIDLEQDRDARPQSVESGVSGDPGSTTQEDASPADDYGTGHAEYSNAEDYEFDESEDFNEAIDGMGFLTVGPRKSGFVGPQSGIAAVQFLRSLSLEGQLEYEDHGPSASSCESVNPHEALDSVSIDEMVNDYFTLFHPAYPLLHEGLFRARMAGMAPIPRDGSWPLLYNMVIAMGAFVGDAKNTSLDLGFYKRARESISLSVLGKGSLCYVQALVLMGNYLQKRNKPNAGFAMIGIAWSMALSIGLHREFGNFSTSPFTMELRRRTWWVLFVFVSGAQLTFGRPPVSLVGVNVRAPTNLEDSELMLNMETLPASRNSATITSCLIAQIQLAVIANAVQTELLTNRHPRVAHTQQLDAQITEWLTALPNYLQENSQLPSRLELPKYILLWRSLHLRIVLHRPFLYLALRKTPGFSTEDECVKSCISTADKCVDSIHAFLGLNSHSKRGFAWYATYWLLSACFIHATCLAYRPTDADAPQWKYRLERALESLQILAPTQGIAIRAQRLLSSLVDRYNSLTASATAREPLSSDMPTNPGVIPSMEDFQAASDVPLYGDFNADGQTLPMGGIADDLLWLWPQNISGGFLDTGNDFM